MFSVNKEGDLDIKKRLKYLNQWLNKDLSKELGEIAYTHFMSGFPKTKSAKGGRKTDASKGGWPLRKRAYNHPVLQKSGTLKKSIRLKTRRRYSTISTSLFYAEYHNKGMGRLPQREFIGKSSVLERRSRRHIKNGFKSIFKSLNPTKPSI